ncbi:hypothetical protein EON63_08640 [archaeon]|nr:MAG: hypothetical protein EON63_08640 [archaeon]
MKNMVVLRRVRGVKARGTRFLSNRTGANPFEATYLNKREANYMPLSPVSFLLRNMEAYPDYIASIHGNNTSYKLTWQQMGERASQLASSLTKTFKLKKFDVVSIISANSPAMYEAHFALPGAGIILHTINTRLDATTIAYQLKHCQAKVVLMDTEYTMLMAQVRQLLSKDTSTDMPQFVYIQDPGYPDQGELDSWQGSCISYDDLLEGGDKHHPLVLPSDELDPITLNYTSGTTGNPKGVVAHHRGAYLNAISNVLEGHIEKFASYLWGRQSIIYYVYTYVV